MKDINSFIRLEKKGITHFPSREKSYGEKRFYDKEVSSLFIAIFSKLIFEQFQTTAVLLLNRPTSNCENCFVGQLLTSENDTCLERNISVSTDEKYV